MMINLLLLLVFEPTLNRVPVFNLTAGSVNLEIAVYETVYTQNAYTDVVSAWNSDPDSLGASERVMARYISLIQDAGLEEALTLYDPRRAVSNKERQMSTFMDKVLGAGRVAFERGYFFDQYQLVFIRPANGNLITLGLVKVDGKWYRSDQWEWADGVRDLFYYMADNSRQGLDRVSSGRDYGLKMTLQRDADENGNVDRGYALELLSDGVFFPYRNTWRRLDNHKDLSPVQARVIHAFQAAEANDDESFLAMWSPESRTVLQSLRDERPSDFYANRDALKTGGGIKSVCAMDLGDTIVFYYYSRRDPLRLSTLYLKKFDNNQYLLTKDLTQNLRVFFESPPVEGRVNRQWLTYRKKIRKER